LSQFHGFEELCPGVPQYSVKDAKYPSLFSSHDNTISLRMYENFDFPTVAENVYRSMTAINQPLTARNRTGREAYVD